MTKGKNKHNFMKFYLKVFSFFSGFRSVEDISPVELTPLQIRTFILNVVWN